MSDSLRRLTERFGLSQIIVAVLGLLLGVFVIGMGFDFVLGEVLEVIVTAALVAGVMGVLAGTAYGAGLILDWLERQSR
jgi:hypothetical protein